MLKFLIFLICIAQWSCVERTGQTIKHADTPRIISTFPLPNQQDVAVAIRPRIQLDTRVFEQSLKKIQLLDHENNLMGSFVREGNPREFRLVYEGPELSPGSNYKVVFRNVNTSKGTIDRDPLFQFSTNWRAAGRPTGFRVDRILPSSLTGIPFTDATTIRILLSRSVERSSVILGKTLNFTGPDGQLVPGNLFIQGSHLSFDPHEDLVAGQPYRLELTGGIRDLAGNSLGEMSLEMVPVSTQKHVNLAFDLAETPVSKRVMSLDSVSVGAITTQISGNLVAEFADMVVYSEATPMVLRKGQKLTAKGIEVKIAGGLGFEPPLHTGTLTMTLVTDANGYLIRNPYNTGIDGGSLVFIDADVALSAEDPAANSLLQQNKMQVRLSGSAKVVGRNILMDVRSKLTFDILGIEKASAEIHLEASSPAQGVGAQESFGQGTTPDEIQEPQMLRGLDGPRTFEMKLSKPEVGSLDQVVTARLLGDQGEIPHSFFTSGSSLWLAPTDELLPGTYELRLDSTGHDDFGISYPFEVNVAPPERREIAPYIMAVFPGVPCQLVNFDWDVGGDIAGRCKVEGEAVELASRFAEDHHYQVFKVPHKEALRVYFSDQIRDYPLSLSRVCGDDATFGVFKMAIEGGSAVCQEAVQGLLKQSQRGIEFQPYEKFEPGSLYTFKLKGGNDVPWNTNFLNKLDYDQGDSGQGGPDFIIPFRAEDSNKVIKTYYHDQSYDHQSPLPADATMAEVKVKNFDGIIDEVAFMRDGLERDVAEVFFNGILFAEMDGQLQDDSMVLTLLPGFVYGSSAEVKVKALTIENPYFTVNTHTHTFVMRMKSSAEALVRKTERGLEISATLDAYLDAPHLKVKVGEIELESNLQSRPLSMSMKGLVTVDAAGHLAATIRNIEPTVVPVTFALGTQLGQLDLEIPAGRAVFTLKTNRPSPY